MFKKILGVLLAAAVFAAGIYYYGPAPVSADDEKLHLTLQEAVELALKENAEVNLARIGVEKAEVGLRETNSRADSLEKMRDRGYRFGEMGLSSFDYYLAVQVSPRAAEMELTLAKKGLETVKRSIQIAVENAYYDVLKARMELEIAESALKRGEEQLRLAQVNYEVGAAARLEVISAEVALASKRAAVTGAKNTYASSVMDLNNTLGLPLEEKLNLTSSFDFTPVQIDLARAVKDAQEVDLSYIGTREGEVVAQKQFDVAVMHYAPNVFTYRKAEYDYEEAKLEAEQAEKELELNVNKAYLALRSAEERYHTVEKSLEQAEESYRLTKLRYEVGMGTHLELENAGGSLDEARSELLSALYDYNLMKAQFDHSIFGGGI